MKPLATQGSGGDLYADRRPVEAFVIGIRTQRGADVLPVRVYRRGVEVDSRVVVGDPTAIAIRHADHVHTTTELFSYCLLPGFFDKLPDLERLYPPREETHHGS